MTAVTRSSISSGARFGPLAGVAAQKLLKVRTERSAIGLSMHPLADDPVDTFADEIGDRDALRRGDELERRETLVVDVKVGAFHDRSPSSGPALLSRGQSPIPNIHHSDVYYQH